MTGLALSQGSDDRVLYFILVPVPLDVPEHKEKKLIPKPTEITDTQRCLTRRENKAH